ncbi:MAG: HDIG domain-containing metalloprotein [Terracidiphilus sp.]
MLKDRNDAYELLQSLGAPARLIHHAQVVSQVADLLLKEFKALGVSCDILTVELGAVLHDTGKTQHPQELSVSGTHHQQAGKAILLAHGVQPEVARCCVSHGVWNPPEVSFEERIVALADKLWKGKRIAELELSIMDEIAARSGVSRWDIFEKLDTIFEDIAAGGAERIQQYKNYI